MPASSLARRSAPSAVSPPSQADPAEARWVELFGSKPPRSPSLLAQAIAWKEQVLAQGDVGPAVARDLALVAGELREGRAAASVPGGLSAITSSPPVSAGAALPPASSQLVPGTKLVKAYGGKTHVVEVIEGGMLYEGHTYASLSAVAKVITGTHWNGLLFFGLRKRRVYPAKAASHG